MNDRVSADDPRPRLHTLFKLSLLGPVSLFLASFVTNVEAQVLKLQNQTLEIKKIRNSEDEIVALELRDRADGSLYQRLEGFSASPPEDVENLRVVDVNFDGHDDIMLMEFLPAAPNVPYLYWIFNPITRYFERNTQLSECITEQSGDCYTLTSPEFDRTKRQIVTHSRASAIQHETSYFKWDGDRVVLSKTIRQVSKPNGDDVVTVLEMVHGRLAQTHHYVKKRH